ncbi:MAG: secondary thiamine-phosphate synthase enzyme YjbQ [Desulfobacterota bacterium]|nr:secondary thiamine-phosphate synthase enzyme YjbQ [Thermodesulfobacteriota bacterium]
MEIHRTIIRCHTSGNTDVIDLTPQVAEVLRNSGIREGVVFLFISGSTAALTTIEYEQGVINDLIQAIEKIVPKNISYQHNLRWGDGNGYSHVRASLIGPSLNIPVANKKLLVGAWQQIVLLDFDNRPREREVVVQIIGN